MIEALLSISSTNPNVMDNYCVKVLCEKGFTDCLDLFLQFLDDDEIKCLNVDDNFCIRTAARHGHTGMYVST